MINISENKPIDEKFDVIIPFNYIQKSNGDIEIYVYEKYKKIAKRFEIAFRKSYFCTEAMLWIENEFKNELDVIGYERDPEDELSFYYSLTCKNPNTSVIKETTIQTDAFRYETVINGKSVLCAELNDLYTEDYEITVETGDKYRCQGYAASNIAALAKKICEAGNVPMYCTKNDNIPSKRAAEKAGFIIDCIFYDFNCYRKQ